MTRFTQTKEFTNVRDAMVEGDLSWQNNNTVHTSEVQLPGGATQRLIGRVAAGRADRPVIIQPLTWSDTPGSTWIGRSIGQQRDATGCTVMSLGWPGMGADCFKLTREQASGLRRGSFDAVTQAQWLAADAIFKQAVGADLRGRETWLWGGSLGASGVVSMASTAPEDMRITRLGIFANVSLVRRSLARLTFLYATSGLRGVDYYNNLSPTQSAEEKPATQVARDLIRNPRGFVLPVVAMAKGFDWQRLLALKCQRYADVPTVFMTGEYDRLSTVEVNQAVSARTGSEYTPIPGEHHIVCGNSAVNAAVQLRFLG